MIDSEKELCYICLRKIGFDEVIKRENRAQRGLRLLKVSLPNASALYRF